MNALYVDRGGTVIDPLGGLPDLRARRVRFIGEARARIARLQELGLLHAEDAERRAMRQPRVGLYRSHRPNGIDEGWTRFILERFEFPFDVVYPQQLDAGDRAGAPQHRVGALVEESLEAEQIAGEHHDGVPEVALGRGVAGVPLVALGEQIHHHESPLGHGQVEVGGLADHDRANGRLLVEHDAVASVQVVRSCGFRVVSNEDGMPAAQCTPLGRNEGLRPRQQPFAEDQYGPGALRRGVVQWNRGGGVRFARP